MQKLSSHSIDFELAYAPRPLQILEVLPLGAYVVVLLERLDGFAVEVAPIVRRVVEEIVETCDKDGLAAQLVECPGHCYRGHQRVLLGSQPHPMNELLVVLRAQHGDVPQVKPGAGRLVHTPLQERRVAAELEWGKKYVLLRHPVEVRRPGGHVDEGVGRPRARVPPVPHVEAVHAHHVLKHVNVGARRGRLKAGPPAYHN
mmetsp:Transcript_58772/g.165829  ORF Transcript_58772/g.165829 Transcript_58772/m.165829 type:complete len:201 (+) Transcript_58772:110-712(+)